MGDEAIIIFGCQPYYGDNYGTKIPGSTQIVSKCSLCQYSQNLHGPQKGMIAFLRCRSAEKANAIIDGYLFSSPHNHHMLALATTILELEAFGQDYADQIIKNSNAVAQSFC